MKDSQSFALCVPPTVCTPLEVVHILTQPNYGKDIREVELTTRWIVKRSKILSRIVQERKQVQQSELGGLKQSNCFDDELALTPLISCMSIETFPANTCIYQIKDSAEKMYIILEGAVDIYCPSKEANSAEQEESAAFEINEKLKSQAALIKHGKNPRSSEEMPLLLKFQLSGQFISKKLEQGDSFGDIDLFLKASRGSSAVTCGSASQTTCLCVKKSTFQSHLSDEYTRIFQDRMNAVFTSKLLEETTSKFGFVKELFDSFSVLSKFAENQIVFSCNSSSTCKFNDQPDAIYYILSGSFLIKKERENVMINSINSRYASTPTASWSHQLPVKQKQVPIDEKVLTDFDRLCTKGSFSNYRQVAASFVNVFSLGVGDFFGEEDIIKKKEKRSFQVVCNSVGGGELLVIGREVFERIFLQNPSIKAYFLQNLPIKLKLIESKAQSSKAAQVSIAKKYSQLQKQIKEQQSLQLEAIQKQNGTNKTLHSSLHFEPEQLQDQMQFTQIFNHRRKLFPQNSDTSFSKNEHTQQQQQQQQQQQLQQQQQQQSQQQSNEELDMKRIISFNRIPSATTTIDGQKNINLKMNQQQVQSEQLMMMQSNNNRNQKQAISNNSVDEQFKESKKNRKSKSQQPTSTTAPTTKKGLTTTTTPPPLILHGKVSRKFQVNLRSICFQYGRTDLQELQKSLKKHVKNPIFRTLLEANIQESSKPTIQKVRPATGTGQNTGTITSSPSRPYLVPMRQEALAVQLQYLNSIKQKPEKEQLLMTKKGNEKNLKNDEQDLLRINKLAEMSEVEEDLYEQFEENQFMYELPIVQSTSALPDQTSNQVTSNNPRVMYPIQHSAGKEISPICVSPITKGGFSRRLSLPLSRVVLSPNINIVGSNTSLNIDTPKGSVETPAAAATVSAAAAAATFGATIRAQNSISKLNQEFEKLQETKSISRKQKLEGFLKKKQVAAVLSIKRSQLKGHSTSSLSVGNYTTEPAFYHYSNAMSSQAVYASSVVGANMDSTTRQKFPESKSYVPSPVASSPVAKNAAQFFSRKSALGNLSNIVNPSPKYVGISQSTASISAGVSPQNAQKKQSIISFKSEQEKSLLRPQSCCIHKKVIVKNDESYHHQNGDLRIERGTNSVDFLGSNMNVNLSPSLKQSSRSSSAVSTLQQVSIEGKREVIISLEGQQWLPKQQSTGSLQISQGRKNSLLINGQTVNSTIAGGQVKQNMQQLYSNFGGGGGGASTRFTAAAAATTATGWASQFSSLANLDRSMENSEDNTAATQKADGKLSQQIRVKSSILTTQGSNCEISSEVFPTMNCIGGIVQREENLNSNELVKVIEEVNGTEIEKPQFEGCKTQQEEEEEEQVKIIINRSKNQDLQSSKEKKQPNDVGNKSTSKKFNPLSDQTIEGKQKFVVDIQKNNLQKQITVRPISSQRGSVPSSLILHTPLHRKAQSLFKVG